MGMVFGKIDVAEPAFEVLLSRINATTSYEIRKYGKRFAIEAEMNAPGVTQTSEKDKTRSPFMSLAGYIGVMSAPQNEGATSIAMTAPVVMKSPEEKKGTAIAMTAPVVMTGAEKGDAKSMEMSKMQFILPAEYDDMAKIPKPTNSIVKVKELSPALGAVHRYAGSFEEKHNTEKAMDLMKQLNDDGISLPVEDSSDKVQFWGYNPPFTIPFLRRNEVWVELTQEQVESLMKTFPTEEKKEE